jgi:N-acetyl-gamma-glutamyl-phosphate reductase
MNRGILSTVYAGLRGKADRDQVLEIYRNFYAGSPFVRVLPPGMLPGTKPVSGSNHCDVGLVTDARTGRVIVVSAIDNLIKGASGQAVQNMNIMFGLPEAAGLDSPGIYP